MEIKPGSKVELKNGTKGIAIGQLESGEYMVKDSRKGDILYCKEKDIASVKDK